LDEALAYEHAVRRRLRLQASVALAGQGGATFTPADAASLTGQLVLAHTAERAIRDGATGALPIDALSRRLELGPLDEDLALVAALLETDAVFALSLAAIAGGDPRHGVSAKLLAQLLGATTEDRDLAAMRPDDDHPLVRAGLLVSNEPPAVTTLRAWRMPPRVAAWLWGRDADDVALRRCGGLVTPPPRPDTTHLAEAMATARRLLGADRDDPAATALALRGPAGAGRRMVAALAAAEAGRACVQLDLARASTDRGAFELELAAFQREVWLRDAVPVVANLDALAGGDDAPRLALVTALADAARGPIAFTLSSAAAPTLERRTLELRIDAPDAVARGRMWRAALADAAVDGPALDGLAARYALTPALIDRAAASAVQLAGDGAPTPAQLQAGVASVIHERFGGLATHVEVRQRWDDLVLPQDTADDVRAFISRAGSAAKVYEQWGFRDKLQRGLGLAALLSGRPAPARRWWPGSSPRSWGSTCTRSTCRRWCRSTSARPRSSWRRCSTRPRPGTRCCCSTRPTRCSASAPR
jgi:hypothetical protein